MDETMSTTLVRTKTKECDIAETHTCKVAPKPKPGAECDTPQDLNDEILTLMPALRAYARSLASSTSEADDLLQETLVKALANTHRFTPGTNLRAWLFTIQRNTFYTLHRKKAREYSGEVDPDTMLQSSASQEWTLKAKAVNEALNALPNDQREALVLVGGAGLSYEEAAAVCGCALGTIKSRVNRGRNGLLDILEVATHHDYLQD